MKNPVCFLSTNAHLALVMATVTSGFAFCGTQAHANVFASNLQLGGVATNLVTTPGDSVAIAYLLNQNASAGVTISIIAGTNVVWSTNCAAGSASAQRGTNVVIWSGTDTNGNIVNGGFCSVRVTAAATNQSTWSRLTLKDNTTSSLNGDGYAWSGQGIAVNNNTNSPHFGRIFVGNAQESGSGSTPGDLVGIAKYNADGSYANEGAYSTGGWSWDEFHGQSPSKIEVGADDRVYVVDGAAQCAVLSFDQLISTNVPQLESLRADNLLNPSVTYGGLAVTGSGTNRQVYMGDIAGNPGAVGIRRWNTGLYGAAATNDTGVTTVAAGAGLSLNFYPQDVAVDSSNRIFTIQNIADTSSSPRVLGFSAYPGVALSNALWTVTDISLLEASGVAAAIHTNLLAVVCYQDVGNPITIFNRDTGVEIATTNLNGGTGHGYTDAAWDRAGNLYVTDANEGRWRVFSPPGANQFTTVALQTLKIGSYAQPTLVGPKWTSGQFQVTLSCEAGLSYALETSTNLVAWTSVATNLALSPAMLMTVPATGGKNFYRARLVL